MSYETEHPKWRAPRDLDKAKLASAGFEDISYRLDDYPVWANRKTGHTLGIDYAKYRSLHATTPHRRYHVFQSKLAEGETEFHYFDEVEHVLSTNSFAEVIKDVSR